MVLHQILSSQYLSGHRAEAEKWGSALLEAEQILEIWKTVQTNVCNFTYGIWYFVDLAVT